jgi:cysteine desulfurase
LRDQLIQGIAALMPESRLNGHRFRRLPNNVNVSFAGVRGDALVAALDKAGIAASAGAACGSSTWEPSHVLLAMGLSMPEAMGGLRLTLSDENTPQDIEALLAALPGAVQGLRSLTAAR